LKPTARKRSGETGQALLLVVVAMGIFLIGAVGLAVDGGTMYVHRQMAQAAADAAAQAGIMSMFNGTHATAATPFSTAAAFNCSTTDGRTPCVYARQNRFGGTAADTVTVDFPATSVAPGVTFAAGPDNLIRVTVQRNINTTLMRLLGPATSTVRAVAIAAIVDVVAPVPILVTHPTLSGSLSSNGNPTVQICGGPSRSIQVNSSSTTSLNMNSNTTIDLSRAGPLDSLLAPCTTGTGADFGDFGGPAAYPFTFLPGTKPGKYLQPASPIQDPLRNVPAPANPGGGLPPKVAVADGVSGCPPPASPANNCQLYSPGLYTGGIDVQNETALFKPGLYYIDGGGFKNSANGRMLMATGFPADPATGAGMVVYNAAGGTFDVGANSSASLVGSDAGTIYKGILFFESRTGPANTGIGASDEHRFGGGGSVTLKGTIYITNSLPVMTTTPGQYQRVLLQGTPGSTTRIIGQIITSALKMGGNAAIIMQLDSTATLNIRQVALVK
jgi:hypothetical protein